MAWYRCGGGTDNSAVGLASTEVTIQTATYTSSDLQEE